VEKLSIEWPDAVSIDPEAEARTLRELEAARAMSTEQKVKRLHPDWDDDAVDAEVELIKDEQGMGAVEDPGTFTGAPAEELPSKEEPAEESNEPEEVDEEA
jgi:hypothetical protein